MFIVFIAEKWASKGVETREMFVSAASDCPADEQRQRKQQGVLQSTRRHTGEKQVTTA